MAKKDIFKNLKKMPISKRVDQMRAPGGADFLAAITPTEFAELFPRYYQRGLPDVGGFYGALSKKSQKAQQEYFNSIDQKLGTSSPGGAAGGRSPGGVGGGSTGSGSISNPVMARDIYNYLTKEKGVDHIHAMGIIANIQGESRFNSGIINPNDRGGPSGGLFQFHDQGFTGNGRFSSMKAYVGDDWKTNWKKQIDYAMTEREMKLYLSKTFNDEKEAVRGFVYDFEKPLDKVGDSATRIGFLDSINRSIKSGEGTPTTPENVSRASASTGRHYGESDQCVALSKHFAPGVGAASGWKVSRGNIAPGSVIATMSYNDGSGGKMAKDMPDGRSHYHTGIALTAPDANGNVLILDQSVGRGSSVHMININNYNGEQWGVVAGGEPTPESLKAVELGKSLADQSQLAWIEGAQAPATAKVTPTQQAPAPPAPVIPPSQQQVVETPPKDKQSPDRPGTVQKEKKLAGQSQDATANVEKKEPTKWKVSAQNFRKLAEKENFLAAAASDERIRTGFNDDDRVKAAGAYIDENWVLHADPKKPAVKEVMKGLPEGVISPMKFKANEETATVTKAVYRPNEDLKSKNFMDSIDRDKLLASFRMKETGTLEGKYDSGANRKRGARGAYQFQDKTWQAETKRTGVGLEYKRASDAPKNIQDEVMWRKFSMDAEEHGFRGAINKHYTGNAAGHMSDRALRNNKGQTADEYATKIMHNSKAYDEKQKQAAPQVQATTENAKVIPVADKPAPTPPAAAPETKPKEEAVKVHTAATGGAFDIGDESIKAYPISGIKSDNTVVVNSKEQPLFTMNNKETAVYDPSQQRVDVLPNQKDGQVGARDNALRGDLDMLRNDIGNIFNRLNETQQPTQERDLSYQGQQDFSFLPNILNINKQPHHNPAFKRAMERIGFQETGDASSGYHYSHGNKS